MLTWTPTGHRLRLLMIVLACGLLVAVGIGGCAARGPRAQVVDRAASDEGWQRIDYEGVVVDLPADWERRDTGDCEFELERWGPPGSDPCATDPSGVAFYADATFDPADGPGVRRATVGGPGPPGWAGYVDAGPVRGLRVQP